jgi:cobalt-zinc-cadmium resistance protein CzcA
MMKKLEYLWTQYFSFFVIGSYWFLGLCNNFAYVIMLSGKNLADNLLYSESRRFNSGHIGIGIPIFSSSQKARINASRVKELIADNEYQNELKTIGIDYESARLQYEQYLEAANYFEINSLPEAKTISQTADKQFINGDINYLDWVMLNNQSIVIRSNYLDILKALNESIINLNYLGSKK